MLSPVKTHYYIDYPENLLTIEPEIRKLLSVAPSVILHYARYHILVVPALQFKPDKIAPLHSFDNGITSGKQIPKTVVCLQPPILSLNNPVVSSFNQCYVVCRDNCIAVKQAKVQYVMIIKIELNYFI